MNAPQSILEDRAQAARFRPVRLLWNWLLIGVGVFFASALVPGISFQAEGSLGQNGWLTLVLVVLWLSVLNLLIKPILVLFTLPFVILTFGLGIWVINAALLLLTHKIVPGFAVDGFGAALMGSLVISVVAMAANLLFRPQRSPKGIVMVGIDKNAMVQRARRDHYDV